MNSTTLKVHITAVKKMPRFTRYTTVIDLFKKAPDPDRIKSFSHVIECNNAFIVVLQ